MTSEFMLVLGVLSTIIMSYLIVEIVRGWKLHKRINKLQMVNKYIILVEHQPITCYLSIRDESPSLLTYSNILDWITYKLPSVYPQTIIVILHKKISFMNHPIVKFKMLETADNLERLRSLGFEPIEEEYLPWNESKRETYLNKQ